MFCVHQARVQGDVNQIIGGCIEGDFETYFSLLASFCLRVLLFNFSCPTRRHELCADDALI
jgi:hypothetical protein